jgi:hypothetical protein
MQHLIPDSIPNPFPPYYYPYFSPLVLFPCPCFTISIST